MTAADDAAFPFALDGGAVSRYGFGLTKREFAAIQIMKGLLSNPSGPIQANEQNGWDFCNCHSENIVDMAIGLADSLMSRLSSDSEISNAIKNYRESSVETR